MGRRWPLFAGVLLIASGAAAGLSVSTTSQGYALLLHGLIIVGILVSFYCDLTDRNPAGLGLFVIFGGFMVFAARDALGPAAETLFPGDLRSLEETTIAVLAGWMLAGFCFMQGGRYGTSFVTATGMAVLGLLATVNLNNEFTVCFWVYIFGVVFTWGYERLLVLPDGSPAPATGTEIAAWWLRWHLSATALLVSLAVVFSLVVGNGLHAVTPDFFTRMSGQVRSLPKPVAQFLSSICCSEELRVGTGPVELSQEKVFEVVAEEPALWRAQVFDNYNGSGWTRAYSGDASLDKHTDTVYSVAGWDRWQGRRNRQEFNFAGPLKGFLPAAAAPGYVAVGGRISDNSPADTTGGTARPVRLDVYGCLAITPEWRGSRYWDRLGEWSTQHYEVISIMPPSDADTLRGRGTDYPEWMVDQCIEQMPLATLAGIEDLVENTVRGIEDPYDRVEALRQMVSTRCMYSLSAPAVPHGRDAAAWFLNKSQRGACDLFATALTMCARVAGVPARVATGFQTGEYDHEIRAVVVRHADAHAWTEVYFPGIGWVPYDIQAAEYYEDQSWLALIARGHARWGVQKLIRLLVPVLLVILVAVGALAGVIDFRKLLGLDRPRWGRGPTADLTREYTRLWRSLARRADIKPDASLTPREALGAALARLRGPEALKGRLWELSNEYYRARYGYQPRPRDIAALRRRVRVARGRIREFRRRPRSDRG